MACAAFRILELTDGTTTINLLAETSGLCCTDWDPAIAEGKGGGVWRDSPLSGGRRQAMRKLGNVIERFELQVRNWNPDMLARDTQNLRRLLEKAITYWTARWQDELVWIKAQSPHETNPRYALVHDYGTPADKFPYGQPFWPQIAKAAIPDFALLLERGHWTENEPGTGTAVETSAVETYDERNLGNVDDTGTRDPTTADEVYFANKRNVANITHVHYWDGVGNAWSANLMDAGLPYDMLQNPVAADDVIIFGIELIAHSGPFCSLVFDIETAQNDLTVTWRYSDAGVDPTAWTALTVLDNTNADGGMTGEALDTAGVNSVHWYQPADWAWQNPQVGAGPVLGTIGYWVCAHVTAVGGTPTPPTQQNRDIYTITWPYVEVEAGQVPGDISALSRIKVYNQSGRTGLGVDLETDRIIVGLRSLSRGTNFTAYINFADEQNPAHIGAFVDPADTAVVNDLTAPTGRCFLYNPGAARALSIEARIEISSTLFLEFYGTYHVFMRCKQSSGAAGDIGMQFITYIDAVDGNIKWETEVQYTQMVGQWELIDFGQITLPIIPANSDDNVYRGYLTILLSCAGAVQSLRLYDLILMPVDEWSADITQIVTDTSTVSLCVDSSTYLDIDSIQRPKNALRAFVRRVANDNIDTYYVPIANSSAILQANANQRLWFLAARTQDIGTGLTPSIIPRYPEMEAAHSIQAFRNSRYLSLRGDR